MAKTKIVCLICLICLVGPKAFAQDAPPLLSVPGLSQAVADAAKNSKAVGLIDLNGKLSGGMFVPVRTLHDSEKIKYLQAGPSGAIKQREHMKCGPLILANGSAVIRKLEGKSKWYQDHVEKLRLPDVWLGAYALPPLDSSFRWDGWRGWLGGVLAVGF